MVAPFRACYQFEETFDIMLHEVNTLRRPAEKNDSVMSRRLCMGGTKLVLTVLPIFNGNNKALADVKNNKESENETHLILGAMMIHLEEMQAPTYVGRS